MLSTDQGVPVWVDQPHALVRRGMIGTFRAGGFRVVGESAGLSPVPDLAVARVLVFEADGAATAAALRHAASGRGTRLVATVRDPGAPLLYTLAAGGVSAILLHDELTPDLLLDTVRSAVRRRATLPADLLPRLLQRPAALAASAPGSLTDRERDVLRLLAEGHDTRGIATDLSYSERTVKNVVHDVLTKLNCRTRAQAVGLATRAGVI